MGQNYHKITIAGIDVSSYIVEGSVEDSILYEISKAKLKANKDISDAVTLSSAQTVIIYRSYTAATFPASTIIFRGKIENFEEKNYKYEIDCLDMLNEAKVRTVTNVYLQSGSTSGKPSELFKDLINTYTGLTATGATVQDSGSSKVLNKFVCRDAYVFERCKKLAQSLNWRFYYEPKDDLVYFEGMSFTTNPNDINSDILSSKPVWEEDKSELANQIKIIGANIETQTQETFNGTGGLDTFTLAHEPETIKVAVSSVLKTGGQQGDVGIDYYVDKEQAQIIFVTNCASGSSNVVMDYAYSSPLPLTASNPASILLYDTHEKVITVLDVTSISDLQSSLTKYLEIYSTPFQSVKCEVNNIEDYGYEAGQKVTITDPITAQTATLPIRKVVKRLRHAKDVVECGDKEFRIEAWLAYEVEQRVKKLEEESTKAISLNYKLIQLKHTQPVVRTNKTITIQRINDSFIAGHPINGIAGRGAQLDEMEGAVTGRWTGTSCTLAAEAATKIVGSQSLKLTSSASPFNAASTTSLGDLSAYTGVASGTPTTGVLGVWIYVGGATDISSVTLRVGSTSGNYTEVAGVKTYTDAFDLQVGWNYFVFRLANGATTGTPNWAAVAYSRLAFTAAATPVIYIDYYTIGTGNSIAENGAGDRRKIYTATTTTP